MCVCVWGFSLLKKYMRKFEGLKLEEIFSIQFYFIFLQQLKGLLH
jgi:hypothetical protein